MPTQIQIIKHCCNVCGFPYENYNTAIMCESGSIIPEQQEYHVGDSIQFDAIDHVSDSRSMSTMEEGFILVKLYMSVKNNSGFFEHHVVYVIRTREHEAEWEERIVVWHDDIAGGKRLVGPPDMRYQKNYHLKMPKHLKVLEHIESEFLTQA